MRVVVAGATGAVGVPLVAGLVARGHEVVGVTRSGAAADGRRGLWADAIVADVLDRDALLAAAASVRADAVVHELTAIPKVPMQYRHLDRTNLLRVQGTTNLISLARAVGATRLVTQSFLAGYGYGDHGPALLSEHDGFGPPGTTPGRERVLAALRSAEQQTFDAPDMAGVALRYGLFYGAESLQEMSTMLRRRAFPVPRGGGGTSSYVYLPDAAAATVAAVERGVAGRAYNVCDDEPVSWGAFVAAVAESSGAPRPLQVPRWMLRATPLASDLMTSSIGMSNAKARADLGFSPTARTYLEGIGLAHAEVLGQDGRRR